MKKLIAVFVLVLLPVTGFASSKVHLDDANIDLTDKAALQHGAQIFVNYCLNCHSARYYRYNKLEDLGLTADQIKNNLMFTTQKIRDPMNIALKPVQAAEWFGAPPPDLTLIARTKKQGPDWLYTYLRTFYLDDSCPMGVNNRVFPNVGMPHVLWDLQGTQRAVFKDEVNAEGHTHAVFEKFVQVTPGKLSAEEYDKTVRDLVTFLTYMGEPVKLERQSLGIYVLLFLALFFVVAYLLKKEYWKDVH